MILGLALATAAMAQADVEVIVYDDLFARWDDTRWLVEAELMTPLGTWLAADNNRGITSYAFQIRSVLACAKDARLSKKKIEVRCTIEDIALQATTYRHFYTAAAQATAADILDSVDAQLTGVDVQMQVDNKGGITNLDIEGLTARNERQRIAQEGLRQIVLRIMAGYHLRIPDQAQRTGQVLEHNSELMAVPSLTGTLGSTVLVHTVSPWNGYNLVQTLGEGTVTASVPMPRQDSLRTQRTADDAAHQMDGLNPSGAPTTLMQQSNVIQLAGPPGADRVIPSAPPPDELGQPLPRSPNSDGGVLDLDLSYSLTASGVALFERSSGILSERVWVVDGRPTASSAGSGGGTVPFRNVGRLRLLDQGENPDLGPSRQVAGPGWTVPGLEPWVPLEPEAGPAGQ